MSAAASTPLDEKLKYRASRQPYRRWKLPPPESVGEFLRKRHMGPRGISLKQLQSAMPPWPEHILEWEIDPAWLFGRKTSDEILLVDLALAMDRALGFAPGYVLLLWANLAAHSRKKKIRRWLSKIKPIGEDRGHPSGLPKGRSSPATAVQPSLLKSSANARRLKSALRNLQTPSKPTEARKRTEKGGASLASAKRLTLRRSK